MRITLAPQHRPVRVGWRGHPCALMHDFNLPLPQHTPSVSQPFKDSSPRGQGRRVPIQPQAPGPCRYGILQLFSSFTKLRIQCEKGKEQEECVEICCCLPLGRPTTSSDLQHAVCSIVHAKQLHTNPLIWPSRFSTNGMIPIRPTCRFSRCLSLTKDSWKHQHSDHSTLSPER